MIKSKLFIILIFIFVNQTMAQDSIVKWTPTKDVLWSDFKIECNDNNFMGAKIFVGIFFDCLITEDGNCCCVSLYAYMNPFLSCANLKSDGLLKHEKTHFDVYEYISRLYRKKILEFSDSDGYIDCMLLDSIKVEMFQNMDILQNQYDLETDYSRDEAKQEEWTRKVKKWLEELKEYAEPVTE